MNKKLLSTIASLILAVAFVFTGLPVLSAGVVYAEEVALDAEDFDDAEEVPAAAEVYLSEEDLADAEEIPLDAEAPDAILLQDDPAPSRVYTRSAVLAEGLPGVYKVKAVPGDSKDDATDPATIGIPSIAKQNLANGPTKESPAIITGAAVNYETKTGPTEFTPIPGAELIAPYSYFRWSVVEEQRQEADGSTSTHKKLSGFDGSYYIVRIDVTDLIDVENPEGKYLHVKQENNKALMVASGFVGTTFSDALGNKNGSYSLADNAKAMKDTTGNDKETAYFDVILLSSGKLATGADTGQSNVSSDIKLSFYVDETEDYYPNLKALDPNNKPTFPWTVDGVTYETEADYNKALLTKYYKDEAVAAGEKATSYLIMDSDLEIDAEVDDHDVAGDTPDFWSMEKAIAYQPYDSHTIKLICEVPVLDGMVIESTDGTKRTVILDVNSFDIQIANNSQTNEAGLTIRNQGEFQLMDATKTSGAELAIGDNAQMLIGNGGTMIVDQSCQLEVEYDAASVAPGEETPTLNTGNIEIEDGGKLINNGVVNVEGTEGKPVTPDPGSGVTPIIDKKSASLHVDAGGEFLNYGCLSIKGEAFIKGTLTNYGKYKDMIIAGDPDKGYVPYHKGIQVTWKDDVTQEGVVPGKLTVGEEPVLEVGKGAVLNNYGDIVLVPGSLYLYGTLNNTADPATTSAEAGNLYICSVNEAVIPIEPDPNDPLVVEKRVTIDPPKDSEFIQGANSQINNDGFIGEAVVEITGNGLFGKLTPIAKPITAFTLSKTSFTYTGKAHQPAVTVTVDGKTLVKDKDYKVAYKNNINAGNATVTVTGINKYEGSVSKTFTIAKAANKITKVKPAKKTYKASALLKKGKSFKVTASVLGGAKKTFKIKAPKPAKKYIKINKKTGKVTIMKGLKKGTYKVTVTITAGAVKNYNKASLKKKITINVK